MALKPDAAMAIEHCMQVAFPDGEIPAIEGGSVFLELSMITGAPEHEISEYCRKLGFWKHTPTTLEKVFRERNFPVMEKEEIEKITSEELWRQSH
jgi:hypothetical protein